MSNISKTKVLAHLRSMLARQESDAHTERTVFKRPNVASAHEEHALALRIAIEAVTATNDGVFALLAAGVIKDGSDAPDA